MQLLVSPWGEHLNELVASARSSLVVCCPYVGRAPCETIANRLLRRPQPRAPRLYFLTNLSLDNMLSGATNVEALLDLVRAVPETTVRFLPALHAKVYVADATRAVITSANLTQAGVLRNYEYGVLISRPATVRQVRSDVLNYGELGSPVDRAQLEAFASTVRDLTEMKERTLRSARRALRREFKRRLGAAQDQVLRVRAAGRSPHAIFADAILHILRAGPQRTPHIHAAVQQIHPDLCDDSVERIIDGKRFGKKWKHAVRTAQQHLKREGLIRYANGRWSLLQA